MTLARGDVSWTIGGKRREEKEQRAKKFVSILDALIPLVRNKKKSIARNKNKTNKELYYMQKKKKKKKKRVTERDFQSVTEDSTQKNKLFFSYFSLETRQNGNVSLLREWERVYSLNERRKQKEEPKGK